MVRLLGVLLVLAVCQVQAGEELVKPKHVELLKKGEIEANLMFKACLKGAQENLKAEGQSAHQDLESLRDVHQHVKEACHCMAYDPAIMKAAQALASHQSDGKSDPFTISDEYQNLLMKTKQRCFSIKHKK